MASKPSAANTAVSIVLAAILTSAAPAKPAHYTGVCEASAAAILDKRHFVVASDDSDVLSIFDHDKTTPISRFALAPVTDIEAAARIGDIIFWLTSHSRNTAQEDKPKRKLFFATRVTPTSKLAPAGTPYRALRADIARAMAMDEAELMKSLDIEGLAADTDGSLVIGLRGPLTPDGKARVLRLANPRAVVGLSATPSATAMVELPSLALEGRGIRSIERIGTGAHKFLIVAGPVKDVGAVPKLFWWDGANGVTAGPPTSLAGTVPEALISWRSGHAQVLGDNGNNCSDKPTPSGEFPAIAVDY